MISCVGRGRAWILAALVSLLRFDAITLGADSGSADGGGSGGSSGGFSAWDKARYHLTDLVKAPSLSVGCKRCSSKVRGTHARMKAFYPHSTAAAYVAEADRDTAACQESQDLGSGGHPAAVVHLRQRCYDSKVAALDRALLKMCSLDWVLQDQISTVVHVRVGDSFCGRPPTIRQLIAYLRIHHEPGRPCHLIFSAHESCGELTKKYFTDLITAQWRLNTSRPGLTRLSTSTAPMIEDGDSWHETDRQLCAMTNARLFIMGAGGFSYLASRVRAHRNMTGRTLPDLVPKEDRATWLEASAESSGKILELVERDKADAAHRAELLDRLSRPLVDPRDPVHVPHGGAGLHGMQELPRGPIAPGEATAEPPRRPGQRSAGGGGLRGRGGGGGGGLSAADKVAPSWGGGSASGEAAPGEAAEAPGWTFTRRRVWKRWAAARSSGDRERAVMAEREAASAGY